MKLIALPQQMKSFAYGGRYGCPAFECMTTLSVTRVEKEILLFLDKIFENKKMKLIENHLKYKSIQVYFDSNQILFVLIVKFILTAIN